MAQLTCIKMGETGHTKAEAAPKGNHYLEMPPERKEFTAAGSACHRMLAIEESLDGETEETPLSARENPRGFRFPTIQINS